MAGKFAYRVVAVFDDDESASKMFHKAVERGAVEVSKSMLDDYVPGEVKSEPAPPAVATGFDVLQLMDAFVPGGSKVVTDQVSRFASQLGGEVIATGLSLGQAVNLYRDRQAKIRKGEDPNA